MSVSAVQRKKVKQTNKRKPKNCQSQGDGIKSPVDIRFLEMQGFRRAVGKSHPMSCAFVTKYFQAASTAVTMKRRYFRWR